MCAALWATVCRTSATSRSISWVRLKRVASIAYPVAVFDIIDTVFATGGIVWAKSGLFVIAFSSITVWVAILRRFFLRQHQTWNKWAAVIAITIAIAASGAESVDGNVSFLRIIGVIATLVSALADAAMYIFVEKLLKVEKETQKMTIEGASMDPKEAEAEVNVEAVQKDEADDLVFLCAVTPFELTYFATRLGLIITHTSNAFCRSHSEKCCI